MKTYIVTTGAVFALLVVAHVARIVLEGARVLREPDFVIATILAAGCSAWAAVLLRRFGRTSS